jgi:cob(I)alamin adenosyltransferase
MNASCGSGTDCPAMANRLSKIVTRTGDNGSTGLADRSRRRKNDPRIEAMGAVDELNSQIGLLITETQSDSLHSLLSDIQHDLFDLGGELSLPDRSVFSDDHLRRLDEACARLNADLPSLKEFILPGGSRAGALCHVARTVCRRAERRVVDLSLAEALSPLPQRYLNRLSDLLFVMARVLNREAEVSDVYWRRDR